MPGAPVSTVIAQEFGPNARGWLYRLSIGALAAGAGALVASLGFAGGAPVHLVFLPFASAAVVAGGLASGLSAVMCSVLLAHLLFRATFDAGNTVELSFFAFTAVALPVAALAIRRQFRGDCVASSFSGVSRDKITEEAATPFIPERVEQAERCAEVVAAAPGLIFSLRCSASGESAITFASPKSNELLGIGVEEFTRDSAPLIECVPAEDRARLCASLAACASGGSIWRSGAFRYNHPERGEIWIEAQGAPVGQINGDIIWHGYACDVTERQLSELAMADHTARLQAIVDGARDGIFTLDQHHKVVSVNKAALDMISCSRSDIAGVEFRTLLYQADETPFEPTDFGEQCRDGDVFTAKVRCGDGGFVPVELVVRRVGVEPSGLELVFMTDLTERDRHQRRIEELMLERLSAIGGMTTILGHQINQPLTAAGAYLKVSHRLLERLPVESRGAIGETIEKAAAQITRAGQIVRSLRELVAHGEPDKTLVSLNALINETLSLVAKQALDAGITIDKELTQKDDSIVADRVQLMQVLLNLFRNAIEAMQGSPRRELSISSSVDHATIRVEISDTGRGLGGVDRSELLEPFSTTNAKRMGIGLPMSSAIIEAHYGRLWARPNPQGGAIFGFELPLRDREFNS